MKEKKVRGRTIAEDEEAELAGKQTFFSSYDRYQAKSLSGVRGTLLADEDDASSASQPKKRAAPPMLLRLRF